MKNKNRKTKLNMNYKRLRNIAFDYLACAFFFFLLMIVVVLLIIYDAEKRNSFNLIGLYVTVSILGLIAMIFFYLYLVYGIIYYSLNKDIKLNRIKEAQLIIEKIKPIRQIRSKFVSYIAGMKIYSSQGNVKKSYMFFNNESNESFEFSKSKNCKALIGLTLYVSYYEKSCCIKVCDKKENIIKTMNK